MNSVSKGRYGEYLACKYLKKRHYKILKRNWTCRWGEIDIIALDPLKNLVFVEVKYIKFRKDSVIKISPEAQFTKKKQNSLERAVRLFFAYEKAFQRWQRRGNWQIDLICITKYLGRIETTHYRKIELGIRL